MFKLKKKKKNIAGDSCAANSCIVLCTLLSSAITASFGNRRHSTYSVTIRPNPVPSFEFVILSQRQYTTSLGEVHLFGSTQTMQLIRYFGDVRLHAFRHPEGK